MNKALWFIAGAAVGGLLVSAIAQPTLTGCCWDLSQAARDKIADGAGPIAGPYVGRFLDWSGITARLPKLIEAFR